MIGRIQIAFTLLLVCFSAASNGRDLGKAPSVYEFIQLFDALNHNAGVYLCTIAHRESSAAADDIYDEGKITLAVSQTLFGPDRKSLALPYRFVQSKDRGYKNEGELVWPRLNLLGGKSFVCVVIPGAVDPACPVIEGTDGAASRVMAVDNSDDPKVAEMKAICQLFLAADKEDAAASLKAALKDKRPEMRAFALHATVAKLGKADADGAIGILKSQAQNWTNSNEDTGQGVGLVLWVRDKFWRMQPRNDKFLARCLAILATTQNSEVRQDAIRSLGFAIATLSPDPKFDSTDYFPAAEKAALIEVLKKDTDADPNAQRLKSILLR